MISEAIELAKRAKELRADADMLQAESFRRMHEDIEAMSPEAREEAMGEFFTAVYGPDLYPRPLLEGTPS